jgi:hypothetical protein
LIELLVVIAILAALLPPGVVEGERKIQADFLSE